MKKLLAIVLSCLMVFSLAACGGGGSGIGGGSSGDEGGNDYENAGFTKAQRKVIAEEIGVTTEDEKVVFMYEVEEGDEVVYYDVFDQFTGTSCRLTEYRFCANKDAYNDEAYDAEDSYDEVKLDDKNLYISGIEEAKYSWSGSYQAVIDDYNNGLKAADYILVE